MQTKKQSLSKMGIMVMMTNFLTGFALTMNQNYGSYAYTDLAKITPTMMATCMTVVNAIALVISLVSGALLTATRSRFGKFRPWIVGAHIAMMAGGFLLFFHGSGSMVVNAIVISIGYLTANSMMDFVGAAKPALYGNIAGADSKSRDFLMSRQWIGSNACAVVSGLIVVPLVQFFGKENETIGFLVVQGIFTVMVLVGAFWMFFSCAPYDMDNRKETQEKGEKVNLLEMVKAVVINRAALTVVISDIVRFTGFYVLYSMMVYQCTAVIGDMMAMTYVLSTSSITSILGNLIAPVVCDKLGGRKKTVSVFGLLTGLSFVAIGIFGKTTWGFTICTSFGFFFMSFIDTLDTMMYMDAGEYWLYKTGKDTRPYLLSMYNVAVKAALTLSSVVMGVILVAINYEAGVVLEGAAASTLTWATGLGPGLGYLLPVAIMLLHNVSDEKMAEIIKSNAEKYGANEA